MKVQKKEKSLPEKILKKIVWNDVTKKLWKVTPDKLYIKLVYFKLNREWINLGNLVGFDQKLMYSKVVNRDPHTTRCACKYEVREVVRSKVGQGILNELYGVYESVEDINFEDLPNQFVLKATHGSQMNIICKDKKNLAVQETKEQLKKWMRTNYYWVGREWQYKNIKPRIICEKYLEQDDGTDLMDYRFFCFNGEPKILAIDIDKYGSYRRNLYDMEFNLMDIKLQYPTDKNYKLSKPERFDEMVEIARKLSSGFNHVRVDLYTCNKDIYFGELTFYHAGGGQKFEPLELNEELGNLIKISN
jgi:TupA-like ATPgrasp